MRIEAKREALGPSLPSPIRIPPGVQVPFAWSRRCGDRVDLSGHGPLTSDGSVAGPFGRVGAEISIEEGYPAAPSATLALLASLKGELGNLTRVAGWPMVSGMVCAAPGFVLPTNVFHGCADLLLERYGPEAGRHAGTAIGMAQRPLELPVVMAAEAAICPSREKRRFRPTA